MNRIIILSFTFIFSISASAQNPGKNFIDQNYIEVSGTAEMEVIPDEIHILISVSEKDFKIKQTFTNYEKQLVSVLNEIGVAVEKDFSVFKMNGYLKTSIFGRDEVNTAKEYLLILHDTQTANRVFEEVEKIGISRISVIKLDHSKIIEYRREVKINAIKAAKEKAEALANAIGQQIGRALYIEERNNQAIPYKQMVNCNSITKFEDTSSSVGFRKIQLDYSILVRFELK